MKPELVSQFQLIKELDKLLATLQGSELVTVIKRMKAVGEQLDALDVISKSLQADYDKLRLFDIPNTMAEDDLTSIKGEFGRCTLTSDLNVSVKDRAKLHEWLEDSGNGDMIVPTVNYQTLKAFCKEQMRKEDGELPDETIVVTTPFSRAVIYKS